MDLDGDMDLAEDFLVDVVAAACSRTAAPSSRSSSATSRKLERVQKPFPRIRYEEAIAILQKKGKDVEVRRRLRRRRGDGDLRGVRSPGDDPPLSGGDQSLLHETRSRATRASRSRVDVHRARGLRRNHRRRAARGRSRRRSSSASTSTSCRARPSSGTSTCAATARCRTPASGSASSAPCSGFAGCTTCARPFRSRA